MKLLQADVGYSIKCMKPICTLTSGHPQTEQDTWRDWAITKCHDKHCLALSNQLWSVWHRMFGITIKLFLFNSLFSFTFQQIIGNSWHWWIGLTPLKNSCHTYNSVGKINALKLLFCILSPGLPSVKLSGEDYRCGAFIGTVLNQPWR